MVLGAFGCISFANFEKKIIVYYLSEIPTCTSNLKNSYGVITFMAQQPLKNFDRSLMRVSLPNSILVTLIFY